MRLEMRIVRQASEEEPAWRRLARRGAVATAAAVVLVGVAGGFAVASGVGQPAVYFGASNTALQWNLTQAGSSLIARTNSLPAGSYAVDATATVSTDNVPADFIDCFVAPVITTGTLTNDGHYGLASDGNETIAVTDEFSNLSSGTQLGLYCWAKTPSSSAVVYGGQLAAVSVAGINVWKAPSTPQTQQLSPRPFHANPPVIKGS
jgi:hypothetical protein